MNASQEIKIKKTKDELIVVTKGLQVSSMLTKKSDLQKAIQSSAAHQWVINRAMSKGRNAIANSSQLPSTETQDFVLFSFYKSVKCVVENLVNIEGLNIDEAIALGNTLAKGCKVIVNSKIVHEQVKDALRYGKMSGSF